MQCNGMRCVVADGGGLRDEVARVFQPGGHRAPEWLQEDLLPAPSGPRVPQPRHPRPAQNRHPLLVPMAPTRTRPHGSNSTLLSRLPIWLGILRGY